MTYEHAQEAYRDALEMERHSLLWDEDDLPAHKRSTYAEDMAEAADMRRKEQREEALLRG